MEAREIVSEYSYTPGRDRRWEQAEAAAWLRDKGFERFYYRRESEHHLFFEHFEHHWDHTAYLDERFVLCPAPGVEVLYRKYPTVIKAAFAREAREVIGGERWVRVIRFFHDQKNYGRPRKGEKAHGRRGLED